jgi:hypothetical protein
MPEGASPRRGDRLPRDDRQVQRGLPRDRRGDRRRARRRLRRVPLHCATRTTRAPSGSATARATSTRTTSRSASPRSSTCRTSCAAATTTSRPDAVSSATSRRASRRSARSSATESVEGAEARPPAGARIDGRRARAALGAAHRDRVYDGYTRVRRDTYRLPDGSVSDWDVLDQGDTVAVVAFTDTGDALLFEQYRVGPRAWCASSRRADRHGRGCSPPARASCSRRRASRRGPVPRRERVVGSQLHSTQERRGRRRLPPRRRSALGRRRDGCRSHDRDRRARRAPAGGRFERRGEAARGLLVFARASVTDPVLRRAQARVRSALERALRSTPVADPVDEFALFWDRFDPADPATAHAELGASSTRVDRRMPAPHSSGRRCMTRSARKKPRSRCTGRLSIGAWPPRTARRRSSSWRARCATWATPPPRWRSCARSATTTR